MSQLLYQRRSPSMDLFDADVIDVGSEELTS